MQIRIIKAHRIIVTLCDSELLGKKFEEGKRELEIKENFFKGEEMEEEKIIELMKKMSKEDATFNIVGPKSVNSALKAGIINEKGIGKIQGVPFALVLL